VRRRVTAAVLAFDVAHDRITHIWAALGRRQTPALDGGVTADPGEI